MEGTGFGEVALKATAFINEQCVCEQKDTITAHYYSELTSDITLKSLNEYTFICISLCLFI